MRVDRDRPREHDGDLRAPGARRTAQPAVPAQPGQFLTVRLHPDPDAAPLLRTYSLSGVPSADSYRISVKREPHGAASEYLHDELRVGDVIEAGAPRGSFVLRPGDRPVVLISAGVGATPVLAMLHVLAAERSARPGVVGARRAQRRRARVRAGGATAARASCPTRTASSATASPAPATGLRRRGRLDRRRARAGRRPDRRRLLPLRAARRSCTTSPPPSIARGAAAERISTEVFGPADPITPGIVAGPARVTASAGRRAGTGPADRVQPQQPVGRRGTPRSRACSSSPRPATSRCGGRAGPASATPARPALISGDVGYRPDPLEPPAPGTALICCSQPRARSRSISSDEGMRTQPTAAVASPAHPAAAKSARSPATTTRSSASRVSAAARWTAS